MTATRRQSILDDLYTQLALATGVVTCERVLKTWDAVPVSERPWVGFCPERETFEHEPCNELRITMPVIIEAHTSSATESARTAALSTIRDAILYRVLLDSTRGGYAVSTSVVSCDTDEGDPDALDSGGGYSGTMVMELSIVYRRDAGTVD